MLVHKPTQSLVLKLQDPKQVASTLPQARVVSYKGQELLQAKHDLATTVLLRKLGFKAPSPLDHYYGWPGPFPSPMDHQRGTADFMTTTQRGFILNDMGTGKTQAALWAMDYLMTQGVIRRAIVVAPKSTCRTVWANAVQNTFLGKRSCELLLGDKRKRKTALKRDADFYVINHDGIKVLHEELKERGDLDLWLLDEGSDFTNPGADRFKVLHDLTPPIKWFWIMTATPVSGSPVQAWALAKLLRNGRADMSQESFKLQTMIQVTKYKWVPRAGSHEDAYAMLQPAVRFKKADCIDLPPVTYQQLQVDLNTAQRNAFMEMTSELTVVTEEGEVISAPNAAAKLNKLLQICCGFAYAEQDDPDEKDRKVVDLKPVDRIKAVADMCSNTAGNSIVFAPFTAAIDKLKKSLSREMPSGTIIHVVDGRTSDKARSKIFDQFENKNTEGVKQVLIAHPRTAAHGLTLVSADLTVWYAPVFSLDHFAQANERMNRPGQTRKMTVVMLQSTALEQGVYAALQSKKNMQELVMSMYNTVRSGELLA